MQNEINHIDYLIEKGKAKGMVIGFNPSPFDEKILEFMLEKLAEKNIYENEEKP